MFSNIWSLLAFYLGSRCGRSRPGRSGGQGLLLGRACLLQTAERLLCGRSQARLLRKRNDLLRKAASLLCATQKCCTEGQQCFAEAKECCGPQKPAASAKGCCSAKS